MKNEDFPRKKEFAFAQPDFLTLLYIGKVNFKATTFVLVGSTTAIHRVK
jgi:hypothetical protein